MKWRRRLDTWAGKEILPFRGNNMAVDGKKMTNAWFTTELIWRSFLARLYSERYES